MGLEWDLGKWWGDEQTSLTLRQTSQVYMSLSLMLTFAIQSDQRDSMRGRVTATWFCRDGEKFARDMWGPHRCCTVHMVRVGLQASHTVHEPKDGRRKGCYTVSQRSCFHADTAFIFRARKGQQNTSYNTASANVTLQDITHSGSSASDKSGMSDCWPRSGLRAHRRTG